MQEILTRAGCFIAIIILGYTLRRFGFFKEDDFKILSKIVIKITLPASIVFSFSGKVVDPAMLSIAALGLGGGLIYMGIAWLLNRRRGKEQQAVPAFTGEMDGDVGLSSAINSISIVISIVAIVSILLITL